MWLEEMSGSHVDLILVGGVHGRFLLIEGTDIQYGVHFCNIDHL
jgi:hypothetical protein